MNDIYKEVHEKLNMYKLTKVQRAMFYQQIQDVVEQIDEEKINDKFLDDLINDIFAYNDIDKILVKDTKIFRFDSIFWGLLLIFTSILIIFTYFNIIYIVMILLIPLTVYFFVKRWFFVSIITLYLIINFYFGIGSFSAVIGLIIAYIGFKILFSTKKSKVKYHKFESDTNYKEHASKRYHDYYSGEFQSDENIDNEVLFINNNFNGTNLYLRDEQINYINLQNKCGGVEVDLKSFEFPKGDLVINLNNSFGGAVFYINDNTEVKFLIDSKFGGVSSSHKYANKDDIKHKIYIQGKNTCGGIEVK